MAEFFTRIRKNANRKSMILTSTLFTWGQNGRCKIRSRGILNAICARGRNDKSKNVKVNSGDEVENGLSVEREKKRG